jgi:hypothetical protein
MSNIKNFIQSVTTNGGASLNINSGEFNPNKGYFVSIAGAEKKINDFSGDDLKNYILENAELLNTENVFLRRLDAQRRNLPRLQSTNSRQTNGNYKRYGARTNCNI